MDLFENNLTIRGVNFTNERSSYFGMILTRLGVVEDIALLRVDKYIVLRSILQTRVTVAVGRRPLVT